jgi:transcriptional regulator with XRE-family HTH domain
VDRGAKIRNKRMELGLSQAELARRIGKTRGYINTIEKTGKVNDLTYYDILRKLDLSPEGEDEIHLAKRMSILRDQDSHYTASISEIEFLRREISTLREMVELQKAVIEMLRKERR